LGDVYLQFNEDNPVAVTKNEEGKTIINLRDILTARQELELEADLVVLVTGMAPRQEQSIADILKVPRGRDRFYNEVHPKLRPVETVMDGIYIAGTCQGPKTISESIKSSLTAASKIYTLLCRKKLSLEPTQAKVNVSNCEWCEKCSDACPFDAIAKMEYEGKTVASVNAAVCKGCGMCLPVCDSNALDLTGFSDMEIETMIEALAE
jgi:heterodisulfide reductase subunit A